MGFGFLKIFQRSDPKQTALSDEEQSDHDMPLRPSPPSSSSDEADKAKSSSVSRRSSRGRSYAEVPVADDVEDKADADEVNEEDGDDDGDDDEEEELFVVEKILNHMVDKKGAIRFEVKWEGYDSKQDLTWEPEENLTEATEVLQEYYKSVGGREAILEQTAQAVRGKKRGRPGSAQPAGTKRSRKNGVHPADTEPPVTKKRWQPPSGSWEDDIENIDACEEEGGGKLVVYLNWKNGQKTKHDTSVIYKKCPQKMLQFYERHVKIIREENISLGGNEN